MDGSGLSRSDRTKRKRRVSFELPLSAANRSSDQFAPREALVVLALQVVADIFACVRFGPSGADHMCW
jgi:hypothetical protein